MRQVWLWPICSRAADRKTGVNRAADPRSNSLIESGKQIRFVRAHAHPGNPVGSMFGTGPLRLRWLMFRRHRFRPFVKWAASCPGLENILTELKTVSPNAVPQCRDIEGYVDPRSPRGIRRPGILLAAVARYSPGRAAARRRPVRRPLAITPCPNHIRSSTSGESSGGMGKHERGAESSSPWGRRLG